MKEIDISIMNELISFYFSMIPELVGIFILLAYIVWVFWYIVEFFRSIIAVR